MVLNFHISRFPKFLKILAGVLSTLEQKLLTSAAASATDSSDEDVLPLSLRAAAASRVRRPAAQEAVEWDRPLAADLPPLWEEGANIEVRSPPPLSTTPASQPS